jgi:aspartyl-tRNA(Asn)/glutamyl-tRNA(Gln) amidotransferase subunit B
LVDVNFHRRSKRIKVDNVRLEEDMGRLVRPASGAQAFMDYSTAGLPSLRLRTAANFEMGEEALAFLTELKRRIVYLGLASASIRVNAYVALVPYPQKPESFVKLRNLNSFNFVSSAVNDELKRQEGIITAGGKVEPESRLWNEAAKHTEHFQGRAAAAPGASRFAPTDMPPYEAPAELADLVIELPEKRTQRLMQDYTMRPRIAHYLCETKERADYFEKAFRTAYGSNTDAGTATHNDAANSAHWLQSWVVPEAKRRGFETLEECPVNSSRFAAILSCLKSGRIHAGLARQIIMAVFEEDKDPEAIISERSWESIENRGTITRLVSETIGSHESEVRRIRMGAIGPVQFLTGEIMRATGGLADPALVKEELRRQLHVSLVYVLNMGGAISGRLSSEGTVEAGDESVLQSLLPPTEGITFESIQAHYLSEELVPADWASLIAELEERVASGNANGVVVAHGVDTLPYTAPLVYWLFGEAACPVVLASSFAAPGQDGPVSAGEAALTLNTAIKTALQETQGVYVVNGGKILSPLNLKFEHIGRDGFRNWNMEEKAVYSGSSLPGGAPSDCDVFVLRRLLEDAVNSMVILKLYPGMRTDRFTSLIDNGVRNFFLELYDTGTAGFREGPYNLSRLLSYGRRRGVHFYCTSQQEGIVDFSLYGSARRLWREGAVPMGGLTTESAVARFLAASIIADNEQERAELMENV